MSFVECGSLQVGDQILISSGLCSTVHPFTVVRIGLDTDRRGKHPLYAITVENDFNHHVHVIHVPVNIPTFLELYLPPMEGDDI